MWLASRVDIIHFYARFVMRRKHLKSGSSPGSFPPIWFWDLGHGCRADAAVRSPAPLGAAVERYLAYGEGLKNLRREARVLNAAVRRVHTQGG